MFGSNIVIGWVTIEILRAYGRKQRKPLEQPTPPAQPQEQAL
jgi:hypothetical protein